MKRKNKEGVLIHRIHTLAQIGILLVFFGSCTDLGDEMLSEEIAGCTDTEACNFNAEATTNDGSCAFEEDICGICGGAGVEADDCCDEGVTTDDCGVCGGDNSSCVNFIDEILPIFNTNCTGCHGNSSGLNLSTYSNLMNGGNIGSAVIPGDGANSLIIQKLRGTGPGSQMPLGGNALDESLISLIETWINEGALNN
tara:strand:+ start:587 stop:1177 length:591 start_codon:yes stop_codon:yes gene_type:complete